MGQATTSGRDSTGGLPDAVRWLSVPLVLVDMRDRTIVSLTRPAAALLGVEPSTVIGLPTVDLLWEGDREKGRAALDALEEGTIQFYRSRRLFQATGGRQTPGTVWVRVLEEGDRRFALLQLGAGSDTDRSPLVDHLGYEPTTMVLGVVDPSWTITWISSDVSALLGLKPADVIGRVLLGAVQEDDVNRLLRAAVETGDRCLVSLTLHVRDVDDLWTAVRCVLTSVTRDGLRFFILLADDDDGEDPARRLSKLESHLRRIAAEVEASGVLVRVGPPPDADRLPQLRSLSLRQFDILSRLAAGERVAGIASDLHVSQSTVRNHLSAIFERFGVHSQAQLLALLHQGGSSS